jgi:hypothetical protein
MPGTAKPLGSFHFRFSLRTIFALVTVFCLWFGYQINWIHKRQAARHWIEEHAIRGSIGFYPEPRPDLPWSLRLLGERPEVVVVVCDVADDPRDYSRRVDEIRRLFPEAQVVDMSLLHARPWPDV